MGAVTLGGIVAVLLCLYAPTEGLECLSCDRVADINECVLNTAKCTGDTEICFLDVVVLPSLERVFSAGCRAKQICDLLTAAAGKREISKRDNIACAQCCNGTVGTDGVPCNGKLCSQNLQPVNKTCGICDRATDPKKCAVSQQCPPNEMCKIDQIFAGGNVVYELGCELKTVCDVILKSYKDTHGGGSAATTAASAGRRDHGDITLCSACCSNARECNKDSCQNVRKLHTCNNATICG